MAITYVTTGAWGSGTGVPNPAATIDGNFWDLDERVTELEDNPVEPIAPLSATLIGTSLAFGWSNGTTHTVTFAMPVPQWRGPWAAGASYGGLNFFTAPTGELGVVIYDHVADTVFDWAAEDGSSGELIYRNISGSATGALAGLSDVNLTSPTEGDVLMYDGTEWINGPVVVSLALDELTDVVITTSTLATGQGLVFDGHDWVNDDLGDVIGPASAVDDRVATFDGTTGKLLQDGGATVADLKREFIQVAVSDETTDLTTGTAKLTFRMPFALTLTAVRASLSTASSSGVVTFDINEGGSTILSTKLTIDANEKTSTTAATAAVISDAALADDAEITIDIDTAGTGAKGGKLTLIGTRG